MDFLKDLFSKTFKNIQHKNNRDFEDLIPKQETPKDSTEQKESTNDQQS